MMWCLYEILLFIGLLLYIPKAVWRRRLPHRGWCMRLGRYPHAGRARLGNQGTIWIHAVSVGEVIAARPLIRALLAEQPRVPLVLSTVTPAGFEVASRLLGDRGTVIYGPLDFRLTVQRALRTIQPRLLLLMESELWPNLVRLTKRQRIPVVVVNGRVSDRAFRRALRVRRWLGDLLGSMDLLLMQTQADAQRIIEMGALAACVKVLGSLKWDASLMSRPAPSELAALAGRIGLGEDTALIVAGSTHRGEEHAVLQAFSAIRSSLNQANPALQGEVKLVIAPRHLERVQEVEELARQHDTSPTRLSGLNDLSQPWDVAIVDTMGQLPLYYGLATVVFVGGSLISHGGQNPIEPASLGKPVVFGPSMENFSEIVQQLLAHQAAHQLKSPAELTAVLQELLSSPEEARVMGARAQALVERLGGTSRKTLDALTPFLSRQ